ncbi:MAG: cytochrome c oxidase accessory protein CcoG [Steroidobacteraceae bacterium]|nr:cytochrome c oxidase accessory protein CcoG [Steroidobacteraceae bacterium]MDW8258158.1 cytochrome c oxidase accessory protein CcoG [Gammaproteobacteria bacterium]
MNDATAAPLVEFYERHQKVYPREVTGRFARLRALAVVVLLGVYYLVPWLPWNERQAVLFDLPARRFYIFGLTLFPQDFVYLAALLIIAALSLFFFTALAGRLWCGYACPQTVWTEAFLWIERRIEGDRAARIKLDRGPWTAAKLARKSAKQIAWLAFALWTGLTFVGYFTPIRTLVREVSTLSLGPWETFWVLFYGFATYGNAGYLREQVCKYMCPYARFQSAMFDRDTLIVSYDQARGEPRGARKRGVDPRTAGLGDCIDCTICVQVCPTGIDIRKGLQYECIACAACADACDAVMDKMGYRRGLIRYTSQNAVEGRPTRILRPRVWVYATLLALLGTALVIAIATRAPLDLSVSHDRNSLYRLRDDGTTENVYAIKILNKDARAHRVRLAVRGPGGLMTVPADPVLTVPAGEIINTPLRVRRDTYSLLGSHAITLQLLDADSGRLHAEKQTRFFNPEK